MTDPLTQLDLNLLLALEALLAERQVTRAAKRLHITQSAMSHMLSRLRLALDDEVMVRAPDGMQPTARIVALAQPLSEALTLLRAGLIEHREFDPESYQGVFRFATFPAVEMYAVPSLFRRLREQAPHASLDLCGGINAVTVEGLAHGSVDCVVVASDVPAGLMSRVVLDQKWVTLARRGHPLLANGLTLEAFVAAEHAIIASPRRARSFIDVMLDERGMQRRVALRVQSVVALPEIVAQTDLLATISRLVVDLSAARDRIDVHTCPLPIPSPPFLLMWHPRTDQDPAQKWFREQVCEAVAQLGRGDAGGHEDQG